MQENKLPSYAECLKDFIWSDEMDELYMRRIFKQKEVRELVSDEDFNIRLNSWIKSILLEFANHAFDDGKQTKDDAYMNMMHGLGLRFIRAHVYIKYLTSQLDYYKKDSERYRALCEELSKKELQSGK